MKLVSLNIWGAAQGQIFFDYVNKHKAGTDIFCFQEVFKSSEQAPEVSGNWRMNCYKELSILLGDFNSYFEKKSSGYADDSNQTVPWEVSHGTAIFIKKSLLVKAYSNHIIATNTPKETVPVEGVIIAQAATISGAGGDVNIINFHGQSQPGNKIDTPERLEQSRGLLKVINSLPKVPVILCGDFNLLPETEGIKMLEKDLNNLIKIYKIENTRNEISWNMYHNKQYFADFTFVSPEINIQSFKVPYNLVSDHLPMELEFNLS